MKVVTIAAAKGGATKTTVTAALAVRASQESTRVALFDLNGDQGDLTQWWLLRGEPTCPRIIEVEKIGQDVDVLRAEGFDYLLIDTPPAELDIVETAIVKSDAVIIPVRPSMFDINAVTPIVEMCRDWHKPYSFLLSAVDSKMPSLVKSAQAALASEGSIFTARIRYLQAYITAVSRGKSAAEVDKSCQPEIDDLWAEVKRLAAAPAAWPSMAARA